MRDGTSIWRVVAVLREFSFSSSSGGCRLCRGLDGLGSLSSGTVRYLKGGMSRAGGEAKGDPGKGREGRACCDEAIECEVCKLLYSHAAVPEFLHCMTIEAMNRGLC